MIPFPNPLHPAVVHFPIAFLLLGAGVAVLAVFIRRWHLPLFVAVLLVCGAAGSMVATSTGEEAAERIKVSEAGEDVLDEHEDWGEMARNFAVMAAVLSIAAAFAANKRIAGRLLSGGTAGLALCAAFAVAQAGHYGGELVYRHGAGVKLAPTQAGSDQPKQGHESDKDDD